MQFVCHWDLPHSFKRWAGGWSDRSRRCGCRAFSSWPLSSQHLDSDQAWVSRGCSHPASLFIGPSALRASRKVGWFHFRSLLRLEGRPQYICKEPLQILFSILSAHAVSETPLLPIPQCFFSLATLHRPEQSFQLTVAWRIDLAWKEVTRCPVQMSQNPNCQGWTLSFKPQGLLFLYLVFFLKQWFPMSNCFWFLCRHFNPLCIHWKTTDSMCDEPPPGAALTDTSSQSPHPARLTRAVCLAGTVFLFSNPKAVTRQSPPT